MAEFMLTTILSRSDHQGKVSVEFDGKALTQMDTDTARELAHNFLECAEAAEQDAMTWAFLRTQVGLSEEKAARMIGELRQFRGGVKM